MMGVISDFFSALGWGLLASTAVSVAIFYVLHSLIEVEKLRSIAVSLVLWFFLAFQLSAWVGAAKAFGYVDAIADLSDTESVSNIITTTDNFIDEYPILGRFVPDELDGKLESVGAIAEAVKKAIRGYELRRALWSLGFIVCALALSTVLRKRRRPSAALFADSFSSMGGYGSSGLRF